MGKPRKWKDPIEGAKHEILSAMSALNMPPDPIRYIRKRKERFISETDKNIKHAYDHLCVAVDILEKVGK